MRLIQILTPLAIEPSPKLARWLNKKPNQRRVRQIALANSSNLNADRIVVLRLGLGRDSMAMLVLLAAGELVVQGRVIDPRGRCRHSHRPRPRVELYLRPDPPPSSC